MNFRPKTEEEIASELVMPAGTYDFEVVEAEEKLSKARNEMLVLTVKVFPPEGGFRLVTDYLMEKMAYKLRHFCAGTGLLDAYNGGSLNARMCEGRCGKLVLQVDPERRSEDGTKTYPPKNSVKDYVTLKEGEQAKVPVGSITEGLEDDGIPF